MKLNKTICLVALTALLIFPLSCSKDFLNQKDTTDATEESLFKKPDDVIALVNAIYNTFHDNDFIIKALWYEANFLTQDFHNWGSDTFFGTYEIPTNFGALNTFWVRSYAGIARANSAIPIIESMRNDKILTDELADRLKGEVLFLRGVFYYYLASEFGGVPLELALATDDGRHPRNTQDEVFAAVAEDMTTAASLLPWKEEEDPKDIGRATKGAALAYLGSAQMWLKKYDEAVTTFKQLDGHYQLEGNYLDIHAFNNQNGIEDIFSIQFIGQDDMRSWASNTHWLSTFCLPEEISQTGYAYADKKLYDSFESGDTRKSATVIGPGDEHPDPAIHISNYTLVKQNWGGMNTCGTVAHPWKGTDGARSGYYGVKTWRDPNVTGNPGNNVMSSQNIILMRFGEVLLSESEALFRSGNEAAAWDILNNKIRKRAHLKPTTQPDFMTALVDEYRHELAGEFSFYFLLRRAGEAADYVKKYFDIVIPPGHTLMPIPQEQIAVNQKLVQNPGY